MNDTFSQVRRAAAAVIVAISLIATARGQEPSIEQLLKKLPPPEKLVKAQVNRALQKPDPAWNDPIAKQVFAAAAAGNFSQALNYSRQLAQKIPRSAVAHFLHGTAAMDARQWSEASGAFRSSIGAESNHAIVHLALGVTEMLQDRYATALPALQQSGKLDPQSAASWLLASDCSGRLGRRQESLDFAKRATVTEPTWVFTWIQLARSEKAMGHAQGTLNAIVRAAELTPDSADIQAVVGFSYINLNRIPQAIGPLERAARLTPQDYLIQSQLGYCLETVGQIDAAIGHLRKGASLNSNYGPVWQHLGYAYQKKGRHQEAIQAYERATQIMPGSRLSWQHLAEEYRAVGRTADAQRAASHAGSSASPARPAKKKG